MGSFTRDLTNWGPTTIVFTNVLARYRWRDAFVFQNYAGLMGQSPSRCRDVWPYFRRNRSKNIPYSFRIVARPEVVSSYSSTRLMNNDEFLKLTHIVMTLTHTRANIYRFINRVAHTCVCIVLPNTIETNVFFKTTIRYFQEIFINNFFTAKNSRTGHKYLFLSHILRCSHCIGSSSFPVYVITLVPY